MDIMELYEWEIFDVENRRLRYARTCHQWYENLERNAERAREIVGERIFRLSRLWLVCSTESFYAGSIRFYCRNTRLPAGTNGPRR